MLSVSITMLAVMTALAVYVFWVSLSFVRALPMKNVVTSETWPEVTQYSTLIGVGLQRLAIVQLSFIVRVEAFVCLCHILETLELKKEEAIYHLSCVWQGSG